MEWLFSQLQNPSLLALACIAAGTAAIGLPLLMRSSRLVDAELKAASDQQTEFAQEEVVIATTGQGAADENESKAPSPRNEETDPEKFGSLELNPMFGGFTLGDPVSFGSLIPQPIATGEDTVQSDLLGRPITRSSPGTNLRFSVSRPILNLPLSTNRDVRYYAFRGFRVAYTVHSGKITLLNVEKAPENEILQGHMYNDPLMPSDVKARLDTIIEQLVPSSVPAAGQTPRDKVPKGRL